ncbi:hypothetical protein DFS34DRAFT_263370 [Phlyctochytrium arcticum]|nr:hypothetical protein DFS34DRAFT_263370 [Phlyctochytrium arcticum]
MAAAAAAAASQKGVPTRVKNQVHDDAIWRQTIHYELSTASGWEGQWGFMRDLYALDSVPGKQTRLPPLSSTPQKQTKPTGPPGPYISGLPSLRPPGLTTSPSSFTSDLLAIHDIPRIIRTRYPHQKYTFPATTQMEVGWGWGAPKVVVGEATAEDVGGGMTDRGMRTLEEFGRFARGQRDVLKWWGGSRESLP